MINKETPWQPKPPVLQASPVPRSSAQPTRTPGENHLPRTCQSSSQAANRGARETQTEGTCNFTARVCCLDVPQVLWDQDMVQSCPVSNVMKKTSSLAFFLKPQSWEPCNYSLTELPVLFFKCLAPCNCRKSQKHYSSAPYSFKTKPLKTTMYRHCFLKKYPTLRAHQPYALHSLRHQQMTAGTAVLVWSSTMHQQSLGRWTREGCKPRNQLGSRRSRQRHQTPSSRDSHPEKGKTTTTCKV